jgi:hypothetical protein
MDATALRETVERDHAAALDRLGARDLLVALDGESPTREGLLSAVADSEYAARETFREWADTAAEGDLRETFEAVVEQEDRHLRRVRAVMATSWSRPGGPGPMHAYLRGREESVQRVAGGMVGRTLVSLRTHGCLIAYFDGRDDEVTHLLSELRAETADCLAEGLAALDARAAGPDWDDATAVAGYTVRLAADDLDDASP